MGNKETQAAHELAILNDLKQLLCEEYNLKHYFACSQDDVESIKAALLSAEQNQGTTFPDFSAEACCIELFAISSSEQGRKCGPLQSKQDGDLQRKIANDDERAALAKNAETRVYTQVHPQHSYEHLSRSLRENFENHLNSLRRSKNEYLTRIFVVEYPEVDLYCCFGPDSDLRYEGLCMGDFTAEYSNGRDNGLYRLSRDKENLNWLGEYADEVDYVIFYGVHSMEVINLHNVGQITGFLPWRMRSYPAMAITYATSIFLGSFEKGSNNE